MDELWWYLSRSSGVVALLLLVAALALGLVFSARATGERRRPKWWLDLHNYVGGLAFVFVVIHLVAVFEDELSGLGVTEILVPFTADTAGWGITWGVVATYLLAAAVVTTWPRRLGSRSTWWLVHVLSIPATVLGGLHAWMVGSSRGGRWFGTLLVVLAGLVVYPLVIRLFAAAARRRRVDRRADRPAEPTGAVPPSRSSVAEAVGSR